MTAGNVFTLWVSVCDHGTFRKGNSHRSDWLFCQVFCPSVGRFFFSTLASQSRKIQSQNLTGVYLRSSWKMGVVQARALEHGRWEVGRGDRHSSNHLCPVQRAARVNSVCLWTDCDTVLVSQGVISNIQKCSKWRASSKMTNWEVMGQKMNMTGAVAGAIPLQDGLYHNFPITL